jgi:hypothetical protein
VSIGGVGLITAGQSGPPAGGPPACVTQALLIDPHIIAADALFPAGVRAIDLDGDNDVDVVSASSNDDTIAWYENDGATPPGFTKRLITTGADNAQDVFAIDLDGDNDVDVLSASSNDDTIAWYESDGAMPPGFTEHVITTGADGANGVFAIDVDGDTDIDVLAASRNDDTIAWYENDGVTPPGFTEHVIATNADGARSVFAIDLDGDNDLDVLSASSNDDAIAWYESDGAMPPGFTKRLITTGADNAQDVFAIDLDGDNDVDVLSASSNDDTIAWYESDGAMPPGFTERVITTGADNAQAVFAIDLDGDNDLDVLSASLNDDTVAWFENDGATPPGFTMWIVTILADGAKSVFAVDLDGDGDPDVLSASLFDNTIAWHEMSAPMFGTCCLSDGTCLDDVCLPDCGSMLAWAWTPETTCDQVTCPGGESPAAFLVNNLNLDNFRQTIADLAAFGTRYWDRPGNDQAVDYIRQKLESFGYDNVVLDPYLFQGQTQFNVYATKIGETRPTEMYILGAHLDSFNINGDFDLAPGADDDASGCASVLEMARVFANARTDVTIRFALWNNEETGLDGSAAYVEAHRDLQGTVEEPTWLGMIQQDMILYDHGPGPIPDADVEYQALHAADGAAAILASFVAGAMQRYGEMPAQVGNNMDFTDSVSFWSDTAAISVRENQRVSEIGNGSNPHWHQPTDLPETYNDQDYEFGFNIVKMIAGAVGELVNATPLCTGDVDGDGAVGIADLLALLAAWGTDPGGPPDFDGDGTVGISDLLLLLANWGPCP